MKVILAHCSLLKLHRIIFYNRVALDLVTHSQKNTKSPDRQISAPYVTSVDCKTHYRRSPYYIPQHNDNIPNLRYQHLKNKKLMSDLWLHSRKNNVSRVRSSKG